MNAERAALRTPAATGSAIADRAWAVLASTWALGALVFVATWGGDALTVGDVEALAGLNMAADRGLAHGTDLVFSYGPLGFLKSYFVFYPGLARLAALYGLVLQLALCVSLVWAARRSFPLPIAVALTLVAAMFLRGPRADAAVVALAFIWCMVALRDDAPPWAGRLVVIGGGPFAAIEILAKMNTGVIVLMLLAVTVVAMQGDRGRNVAVFIAGFLASGAALWLVTGQGLVHVGDYISGGRQIASGYASGGRLEPGIRGYDYVLIPCVIAAAGAIAWFSTRDVPIRRRVVMLALFAFVAFSAYKAGIVSHEAAHMATFYATMLGVAIAFRVPAPPRASWAALALIAGIAVAANTTRFTGYPLTNPVDNVSSGASTVARLVDHSKLEAATSEERQKAIARYGVDPKTLRTVGSRPVHVDPLEPRAAWAYGLNWRPLPVFHSYIAWTPALDRENADALASRDGPERILRHRWGEVLFQYPGFVSPAAMIEMLCHFRALRTTPRWQVLGRVPDRCGETRRLGSLEAHYGARIRVPPARGDEVIFARAHGIQVSGLERLKTFLYRADEREVSFDGDRRYTLIPGTAADGLLLRAPRRIDFPFPFALAPNPRHVTFLLRDKPSSDPLTIEFYAMRVSPVAHGRRGR